MEQSHERRSVCRPAALRPFRARRSGGAADVRRQARSRWRRSRLPCFARWRARRSMLVTKNALLDAVWGHRFVTESVLKSAISEVRRRLATTRSSRATSRRYRAAAIALSPLRLARPSQSAPAVERNGAGGPGHPALAGAHRIVPRRCRARRPRPRARCHAGARAACPRRFLAQRASHEDLRATPERSASPAHRGDRHPAHGRTIPASADAVRLLAAARPRRWPSCRSSPGRATPPARICTRK